MVHNVHSDFFFVFRKSNWDVSNRQKTITGVCFHNWLTLIFMITILPMTINMIWLSIWYMISSYQVPGIQLVFIKLLDACWNFVIPRICFVLRNNKNKIEMANCEELNEPHIPAYNCIIKWRIDKGANVFVYPLNMYVLMKNTLLKKKGSNIVQGKL